MCKTKKTIATLLIISLLGISSGRTTHAYWGETFVSLPMKQLLEEAYELLKATMLSSMKQSALKSIITQLEGSISGTGGAGVVYNYEDFIYFSSQEKTNEYLTDFFSVLQSGVSPGEREMLRDVEQALELKITPPKPVSTLHEIVPTSDPIGDVFDQRYGGGVKALMSYAFGEYNNPYNAYRNAKDEAYSKMEQLEESSKAEVIAGQGFPTKVDGGKVTPGSVTKELIAKAEGSPVEMIANANTVQEMLTSFATSMMVSAINRGISKVSDPILTDLERINRRVSNGYADIQNAIYLGN